MASRTEELRRAYDELRSVEELKDRFLASLSHEMNTPLTAILAAAAFLRDYGGTDDQRREMLETIAHSGAALQQMLQELFRVVQVRGGVGPLKVAPTDAERVAGEAVQLTRAPGVSVDIVPLGAWSADTAKLARAVSNLIDNAVKFSPRDRPVELKIVPAVLGTGAGSVPAATISVLDRGPGVEPGDRQRIFAPFEQGGDPLTGKPPGLGLGLYEARRIAELHGGTLEFVPRAGGGSEFRIQVPLDPAAAGGAGQAGA